MNFTDSTFFNTSWHTHGELHPDITTLILRHLSYLNANCCIPIWASLAAVTGSNFAWMHAPYHRSILLLKICSHSELISRCKVGACKPIFGEPSTFKQQCVVLHCLEIWSGDLKWEGNTVINHHTPESHVTKDNKC